jgi:outer membrane protein
MRGWRSSGACGVFLCLFAAAVSFIKPGIAHSETLMQVYDLALANDPAFASAEVQTLIGHREYREALYSYFPRVTGRADYDRRNQNIIDSDNQVFDIGKAKYSVKQGLVELRQPIIDYGRLMRIRKGSAMEQRSLALFANGRQDLILKVCDGYFRSLSQLKRIQLIEAAKKAIETQLRFARERSKAGQVATSELKEIEAQAQLAFSELVDAQNEYRDRLESLVELTGSPIRGVAPFKTNLPLLPPNPADVESWIQMAADGNHELHAQQLATDVASYHREEEIGQYMPNMEATGTYDYTDQGGSQFGGGSETSDLTFGMRVNVPIFNAEGTGYTYIKKSYEVRVESLKLEQLRRKVAREIRDFYNLAIGASRKHKALSEAVAATQVRLNELSEKNRAGQVSSVDVLEAQRDLVRAQRDQFDALVEYILNMTRLRARAGVLSEDDILFLGRFLG